MASTPRLYRQIDADTFVSYNPATDDYEIVPADRAPSLTVVAEPPPRLRLSQSDPQADSSEFRRACLLAMLEFQERAHKAGEPEAADPYLKSLAHLAGDEGAQQRLRMSWVSMPTVRGRYGRKAVGEGEHAGRVLYGEAATRALHHGPGKNAADLRKQRSAVRAREILTSAYGDINRISADHLNELATHLPALPIARLRNARAILEAKWGAKSPRRQQMVDALVEHIRAHVDEQMKAVGMVAEPAPDEAAQEPPAEAVAPPARAVLDAAGVPHSHLTDDEVVDHLRKAPQPEPSPSRQSATSPALAGAAPVSVSAPKPDGRAFPGATTARPPKVSAASATSPALAGKVAPPAKKPDASWIPGGRRADADLDERARNLPEPTPGKLFDAGDEPARTAAVKTALDIADMAQRRFPGLQIPSVKAGAPLKDHLDALTAIDKHVRGLGVRSTYFGDAADHIEKILYDAKDGKLDRDDLLGHADDARRETSLDTENPDAIATELRDAGHEDAALFFERQARKVEKIAHSAFTEAANATPAKEQGPQTVEEIEDRMRKAFGPESGNHANSRDAFDHAIAEAEPEARRAFYQQHGLATENPNKGYYNTRTQNAFKANDLFGPKETEEESVPTQPSTGAPPSSLDKYRTRYGRVATPDAEVHEPKIQNAGSGTLGDGKRVNFVPHESANGKHADKYATVTVDPKKLDAAWSKDTGFYVPPGGGGAEIGGRRAKFQKFLDTGEAVQAPSVGLVGDRVTFDDGRHRFSVLRDAGIDRVPLTVPKAQAEEFTKRFGAESGQPAQKSLDNGNTNDRISGGGAAESEPKVPNGEEGKLLGDASEGAGEGGVRRERVGGPVPAVASGVTAGAGEGTGGGPGPLHPGQGGRRTANVRATDGRGDATGDGAGVGASRPAPKRRLKRTDGAGSPRAEDGTRLGGGIDGTEPALPNPTPHEQVISEPPAPENPTDVSAGNFRYTDREFFKGGQKTKFNANLAAVRTLREIQAEGRTTATPEEQAILSKFTGWGSFPAVFNDFWDNADFRDRLKAQGIDASEWDRRRSEWQKEREALHSVMSSDEWEAAKTSTLNAHYTHPDVVDAHWKLAQQLGFKGGRYLETSAGIGYYLGLMPPELAGKTHTSAVELDPTTGGMLKLLYPASNVNVQGFQEHLSPDNHYDLVASNVPFGAYKVHDALEPHRNRHQASIHDYFFLKSADKVRPGGLVMHITSTGTLDKPDSKIREELAKTCDFVGAVRFPGAAHKENAGTDVVTDMIVLRKRLPGEAPGDQSWLATATVPDPAGGAPIPVNKYFAQNPHMVLGIHDRTGSMYQGDSKNVSRTADYDERLKKALASLPTNVMSSSRAPAKRFEPAVLPAPSDVKEGGFHLQDGKAFVREGGGMTEQKLAPAAVKKIGAHLSVLGALRALLKTESAGGDGAKDRAELNRAYDVFVKAHGPLNAAANKRVFNAPDDSPALLALEDYDSKTKKATKSDIFAKSTVSHVKTVDRVSDAAEGVGVSLHETGGIDVDRIAKLLGTRPEHVHKALVEKGLAYEDPSHGWQAADQYLSGNVRRKLAHARAAAAGDPKFAANVAALEKVQPEDIHHEDIEVKLGAPWVPASDIRAFAAQTLNAHPDAFAIHYNAHQGEWHTNYGSHYQARHVSVSSAANKVWGAGGVNFVSLLQSAMNNTPVTVTVSDGNGGRMVDRENTDAANAKVQQIKDEFRNWIWGDDERRERLHRHYNDNFNNIRPLKYNGAHQAFPGMNPAIQLRDHQKNFVWQVVTTGKGLGGHEVGTGKTLSMVAAAMEMRRLGLAKKPAIACLKANVEAVTRDAQRAYPGAKIISTVDMFDAKSRKQTIARIATGDYDMVILTHDQLNLLGMRPETRRKYMREELSELEDAHQSAIEAAQGEKGNRVVKQLAKAKENLKARLEADMKAEVKDTAVHFEDTGIDHLFVDEAHEYKSLPVYTKMRGLKGVPGGRSQRATNMHMRTRWLMEQNGGRGVVFMTGTPVANTMAELFNMQKYIQPKELEERGLKTFDAWAGTFGDIETKMEKTATGDYKPVSRFSKFTNIPELMQIGRQMLDVQRADDMKKADGTPAITRPSRKDFVHVAPKNELVRRMMADLKDRASQLRGKVEKGADNMLSICTDGRKGSTDLRMLYGDAPDEPDSKTNRLVENVLSIHKANPGKTQMVFSDIGVHAGRVKGSAPTGNAEGEEDADGINPDADLSSRTGFHLYGDIIEKLVAGGIPRDKIADFSQLEGDKKEEAIEGLKRGDILVSLGGTKRMGTGVNAQDKLLALHHLDCPWRPADLEQRDGRGWRQGNENKEVQIHRYVTEGSLDELFWQGIARKSKFIKQVLTPGEKVARVAKEEDTEELSPEQIMAAASGDPRILEKVQTDEDVKTLTQAKIRHEREQRVFGAQLKDADGKKAEFETRIADYKGTIAHFANRPNFELKMGGQTFNERPEAGEAFEEAVKSAGYGGTVGHYKGLRVIKDNGKLYIETPGRQRIATGDSLGSVEHRARNLATELGAQEGSLAQHEKDVAQIRAKHGKPFPKAEELEKKKARQKELEDALSGADKKDDVSAQPTPPIRLGFDANERRNESGEWTDGSASGDLRYGGRHRNKRSDPYRPGPPSSLHGAAATFAVGTRKITDLRDKLRVAQDALSHSESHLTAGNAQECGRAIAAQAIARARYTAAVRQHLVRTHGHEAGAPFPFRVTGDIRSYSPVTLAAIGDRLAPATAFLGNLAHAAHFPRHEVEIRVTGDSRPSQGPGVIQIAAACQPDELCHEYGHELEDQDWIQERTGAFWNARFVGEDRTNLAERFPDEDFDPDEYGRVDDMAKLFPDEPSIGYYVGRVNRDGSNEVFSCGLQLLYRDPHFFAGTDPEYFNLIVGILRGPT